jgi:NADH-quinone oxidoreductase subunit J
MRFGHFFISIITLFSAVTVALSKNPMNAIVFLIITFFNAFVLTMYFNIAFLGLLFVLVYVGAVAILFLFIIMMLNLKPQNINIFNIGIIKNYIFLIAFGLICWCYLRIELGALFPESNQADLIMSRGLINHFDEFNNLEVVGQAFFNYFSTCFLISGLILLVALLGPILLSFNFAHKGVTGQSKSLQLAASDNKLRLFFSSH